MAKTSMIAVIGRIMDITRRRIEANGLCTLERCQRGYRDLHGLPVGQEFVLNIWYQHKELEVGYVGVTGWVARKTLPETGVEDTDDAPDA